MKFTCTKENLLKGLQLVTGSTIRPGNLPVLANVLIKASESGVELVSTNLELAISAHLRAKVDMADDFTVPAKTLIDYVNLLPDEQVTVTLEGNELELTCGSSKTKIKGTPADEFPVIPSVEDGNMYMFDAAAFKEGLSQVVFAAARNDIRPELAGIYFGLCKEGERSLVLAATDSYRLAERTVKMDQAGEERECIVPGKTAAEFSRLLGLISAADESEASVRLVVSQNQISLVHDAFEVTSRLVDGNYPDYRQIIPTVFQTVTSFPQQLAVKQIKAASLFSTSGVNAVQFTLNAEDNAMTLASTSSQTGAHESSIDTEIIGETANIVLNHKYVLDGLSHIGSGEIQMKMNGPDAPCVLKGVKDESYLYIVMPIRQ